MNNKVYFGNYSLEHWMKLLISRNIVLPKYQRHFVWDKEQVNKLVESLEKDLFIPPVTIGAFVEDGRLKNLIIDGQQRLTSILLAFLGIFPIKEQFEQEPELTLAGDNDEQQTDDEDFSDVLTMKWTFNHLLKKDNSFEAIRQRALESNKYEELPNKLSREQLKDRFIGFNYLVPNIKHPKEIQKYYSSVFRSVNYTGVNLLPQESRKALYFLDKDFESFFNPSFCEKILVKSKKVQGRIILDFTRILALLFNYHKIRTVDKVGIKYGRRMETYYELFIQSVVDGEESNYFVKFTEMFNNGNYNADINDLETQIKHLNLLRTFESVIDTDLYFIGLIYNVLFCKKNINIQKKTELEQEISDKIQDIKKDENHKHMPGSLKYIRQRMEASITIYNKYVL